MATAKNLKKATRSVKSAAKKATRTVKSAAKKAARKVEKFVAEPIAGMFRSNGKDDSKRTKSRSSRSKQTKKTKGPARKASNTAARATPA